MASPLRGIDDGLVETRHHGSSVNEVHHDVSLAGGHHVDTSVHKVHQGVTVNEHRPHGAPAAGGGLYPRDIVSRNLPVPGFSPGFGPHVKKNPVVGVHHGHGISPAKIVQEPKRSAPYIHTAVIATPAVITPVLLATPVIHRAVIPAIPHHTRVDVHRSEVDYATY